MFFSPKNRSLFGRRHQSVLRKNLRDFLLDQAVDGGARQLLLRRDRRRVEGLLARLAVREGVRVRMAAEVARLWQEGALAAFCRLPQPVLLRTLAVIPHRAVLIQEPAHQPLILLLDARMRQELALVPLQTPIGIVEHRHNTGEGSTAI